MTGHARNTWLIRSAAQISEEGLHILIDRPGRVNPQILGPNAEKNEPVFWQIAGINGQVASEDLDRTLFELQVQLERETGSSLSVVLISQCRL